MPFGSLYFQGFQTAGLGNSATLDSGLRRKSIGFFWPWFSFLGNSATLDSGLRLQDFLDYANDCPLGNSATLDSGLRPETFPER